MYADEYEESLVQCVRNTPGEMKTGNVTYRVCTFDILHIRVRCVEGLGLVVLGVVVPSAFWNFDIGCTSNLTHWGMQYAYFVLMLPGGAGGRGWNTTTKQEKNRCCENTQRTLRVSWVSCAHSSRNFDDENRLVMTLAVVLCITSYDSSKLYDLCIVVTL